MFSIIVPLFNKSAHIEKCLKSIINQTFTEFEVVVVNDGSTDDSFEKLQEISIANNYSLLIINQENMGVSTARNNGVKAAKYDLIAFLDADDWWEPTYLAEMKSIIETFPKAGIYGSSYYLVKHGIKKIATIGVAPDFKQGYINYCEVYAKTLCMPLWTGATIIPKAIFDTESGFKTKLQLGEDFDLWVRIALKYPVVFLNKPLSNYNQDVDNVGRGMTRKLLDKEAFFTFQLSYLEPEEKKNPELKKLLDNLRAVSLEHYFFKKKYSEEVREIISNIDFRNIQLKTRLTYKLPFPLAKIRFLFYKTASGLKSKMIKYTH
jgi:glycosyltransferase involved in cell wall biosynthesis